MRLVVEVAVGLDLKLGVRVVMEVLVVAVAVVVFLKLVDLEERGLTEMMDNPVLFQMAEQGVTMGGKEGLGSFSKGGGGGGAGSPTDINGQVIPGIPGAPGGNGAMNGFSWTNQIQPNLLYGVGGGGGGAGANGGAGDRDI